MKKHLIIILFISLLYIISVVVYHARDDRKNYSTYSLADFGVMPLLKSDCSILSSTTVGSPISISYDAPNVSMLREKIKTVVTKYNGHITSESFNSYPSVDSKTSPQDSASVTITFDAYKNDFLTDISSVIKSSGGVNTNYNYSDTNNQSYNSVYSSYSNCTALIQNVQADILQLSLFMKALKEEHNAQNIALLSQSIFVAKNALQTDVNNANSIFGSNDKPTVTITVSTLSSTKR